MAFSGALRPQSPCYKCENREPGCHSKCKEYLDFAEKRREDVIEPDPVGMMIYRKRGSKRGET